ncbi:GAF domain-containing protein [Ectothiorhodospira shaposhnikovii]|uniref:GAF domain-containing protein n=1 Tax=Ectothiorhodospira shaposhnikovii TaxID=1054 RepID=UPI001EE97794|nr:GAF domain-containing protein [Ectothiorhodospira shaposhnikovii]MCG5513963.1 GAF domain-containing protein [Ectothiorhodospira shaposhnikovii]
MSDDDFINKLSELASFVESTRSLEAGLEHLTTLVAHAMACQHCSIMLVSDEGNSTEPHLRVEAHSGGLPAEVRDHRQPLGSGIAGQVAGTGKPLLILDLHRSVYAGLARREEPGTVDVISVPIRLEARVIGVINVDSPLDRPRLSMTDLRLATILALVVSKSVQIHRLKGLLKTNFMQLALAREAQRHDGAITQDPARVARLMAHTLYDEMIQAGFARDHVLMVATEILSQVHDALSHR